MGHGHPHRHRRKGAQAAFGREPLGDTWPNEDAVLFSIQRKPTDPSTKIFISPRRTWIHQRSGPPLRKKLMLLQVLLVLGFERLRRRA